MPLDMTGLVHLITSSGYPALAVLAALLLVAAVGVPLPIPITSTLIVLGALTARPDGPNFLALTLVATLAASAGHGGDYWLGRAGSPRVDRWRRRLERRPRLGATLVRVERGLAQHASLVILVTRCLLTPLGSPVSLLAGAARIAFPLYLALELAGTALYCGGYLTLGRLLGVALAGTPLTLVLFALFFGIITLAMAVPSLPSLLPPLLRLLRLRPLNPGWPSPLSLVWFARMAGREHHAGTQHGAL